MSNKKNSINIEISLSDDLMQTLMTIAMVSNSGVGLPMLPMAMGSEKPAEKESDETIGFKMERKK